MDDPVERATLNGHLVRARRALEDMEVAVERATRYIRSAQASLVRTQELLEEQKARVEAARANHHEETL